MAVGVRRCISLPASCVVSGLTHCLVLKDAASSLRVRIAAFLKIPCSRTGLCSRLSVLEGVGRYARDDQ